MLVFQPALIQGFVHPASFSGIYSEDDYVNDMASRAAHDYALAHARVQAIQRQRDHYNRPHRHQHHPGDLYGGRLVPASVDNFSYGFGHTTSARPSFFSPNHRRSATSFEELAIVLQEEERQRALNHRLEAIARQRELAREREAQRRRALAVAAAREQQARAAHVARVKARQAHDEELLLSLLGQLGLPVAPTQSAPVAPRVNRQQPPLMFIHPATHAAPAPTSLPLSADRKGKAKAVDAPVKIRAAIPRPAPAPVKAPTLREELQMRMRTETDPEVRETLFSLYSDLFDAPKPAQPVAGPSGCKHVSFDVPISGPSSSPASSPLPIKTEEKIDFTLPSPSAPTAKTDSTSTARKSDGAHLHRTPALPPAVAAKLLKFYRARRARKLSLGQIKDVEDALRKLEGAFVFPAQLDFVSDRSPSPSPPPSLSPSHAHEEVGPESDGESSSLAYTANNKPVRAYEHALTELLARLDAVESHADLEVRGRRKEVVKEVERALEAMERRIEESRERSRERATRRWGSVSSQVSDASVTVTPYNVHNTDNVDEIEVAVAAEGSPVEVKNEAVALPAEIEGSETTSHVEDTTVTTEDTALQVEAVEPAPTATQDVPEPNVDIVQPGFPQLAVEIPANGADTNAPSPLEQSTHSGPILPVDDVNPPFDISSSSLSGDTSTPHLVSSGAASEPAEAFQGTSESSIIPAPVRVVAPETISSNDESASADGTTLAAVEPNSDSILLPADEAEIISKDEVEPARDGSDWSDVGSESCL